MLHLISTEPYIKIHTSTKIVNTYIVANNLEVRLPKIILTISKHTMKSMHILFLESLTHDQASLDKSNMPT